MAASSPPWLLFLLASIYMVGELGHFLIGVVSRSVAQEIHYGDKGCLPLKNVEGASSELCEDGKSEELCQSIKIENDTMACEWNYTGLGLEYQILAGPSFIAVFTIAGIAWGIGADRFNRAHLLTVATLILSIAIAGTSLATKYWHLVMARMFLALGEAGCSPLAAGMIADVFRPSRRGLAMSIFNWGIYIGYGFSYAVGNYVTQADILNQGWRASFIISGVPGIVIALAFFLTVRDPPKSIHNTDGGVTSDSNDFQSSDVSYKVQESPDNFRWHESESQKRSNEVSSGWSLCLKPVILILGLAACIRHSAGYCWGYNSALYFQTYYPDYDAGWWLTGISIFGGAAGSAIGGYVSDRLVSKLGVSARALVLAGSQLVATPFIFGLLYFDPPLAFFSLLIGYLSAEMWFGVMMTILLELVPVKLRSTALGVGLFIINNVGGNLPIIVDPLASITNYRLAITLLYPGALIASSVLFLVCFAFLRK